VPIIVGLSHRTAAVEVRERLSIPEAKWNAASEALCAYESIQEAAVLSTCNRFEVILCAEDPDAAIRDTVEFLQRHSGLLHGQLRPNLFVLRNEDAIWHLLRVASGLDSLVIGEGQILSQVKACYRHANAPAREDEPCAGRAGKVLGRLLNAAVTAGKFIRSQTDIAKGAVSISSVAVELAMSNPIPAVGKPFRDLRVSVIGAGQMSRLLLTHLASHDVQKITLLSRTRQRAEDLAAEFPDVHIEVKLMDALWSSMEKTDLAFTSTSSTDYIVTKRELEAREWATRQAQLTFIDISVPRNVEASCNDISGVSAYNVDDLKQVLEKNKAKRRLHAMEAELLLRAEHAKFVEWQESLQYVSVIGRLQKKFEAVCLDEVVKARETSLADLSDEKEEVLHAFTKGISNKLLHAPVSYLRSCVRDGKKLTVQQIEQLFTLDPETLFERQSGFGWEIWLRFGNRSSSSQDPRCYEAALASLHGKYYAVRQGELAKAQKKGLKHFSADERHAVGTLAESITDEILRGPTAYVRSYDQKGNKATVKQIEELFMLDKL
jgi:glutamyl-tRNA reductase